MKKQEYENRERRWQIGSEFDIIKSVTLSIICWKEIIVGKSLKGKELGWRKLSQLNLVILQDAFNQLATDTMRADCKSLLVDMLNRAVETELLNKNIAFGINTIIDNEEKEEKRILSNKEIDILLETSKGGQTYAFFIVALGTGMRMGEILGLTWDCIDFENGVIKVEKTLCYLPNNGNAIYEFHRPKTLQKMLFVLLGFRKFL